MSLYKLLTFLKNKGVNNEGALESFEIVSSDPAYKKLKLLRELPGDGRYNDATDMIMRVVGNDFKVPRFWHYALPENANNGDKDSITIKYKDWMDKTRKPMVVKVDFGKLPISGADAICVNVLEGERREPYDHDEISANFQKILEKADKKKPLNVVADIGCVSKPSFSQDIRVINDGRVYVETDDGTRIPYFEKSREELDKSGSAVAADVMGRARWLTKKLLNAGYSVIPKFIKDREVLAKNAFETYVYIREKAEGMTHLSEAMNGNIIDRDIADVLLHPRLTVDELYSRLHNPSGTSKTLEKVMEKIKESGGDSKKPIVELCHSEESEDPQKYLGKYSVRIVCLPEIFEEIHEVWTTTKKDATAAKEAKAAFDSVLKELDKNNIVYDKDMYPDIFKANRILVSDERRP